MSTTIKLFLYLTLGYFIILMIQVTYPYFSFDDHTAFLRIKQSLIHNKIWKTAFYIHVISSSVCLFAGFTQFSPNILIKKPALHRAMGIIYISVILLFSGPSGLIMSIYANGGWSSQLAFTLLSILWITFTFQGLNTAKKGDFEAHQKFIIRSYALTLSALTLRAWKLGFAITLRPHPMDLYRVVAWLGWIPNLIIAEWYIRTQLRKKEIR